MKLLTVKGAQHVMTSVQIPVEYYEHIYKFHKGLKSFITEKVEEEMNAKKTNGEGA
jgi:hypothetical protein